MEITYKNASLYETKGIIGTPVNDYWASILVQEIEMKIDNETVVVRKFLNEINKEYEVWTDRYTYNESGDLIKIQEKEWNKNEKTEKKLEQFWDEYEINKKIN